MFKIKFIDLMSKAEKGMTIRLLNDLSDWHNKDIVVARGMNNKIYIYKPGAFRRVASKIKVNMSKYGLSYPYFHRHMRTGVFRTRISSSGWLTIPRSMYYHFGPYGPLTYSMGLDWLEISKKSEQRCICENPHCRKCRGGNCTNQLCTTHRFIK